MVRALEDEMAMTEQHEFDKFQDMVDRYSKQLHSNNYQLQVGSYPKKLQTILPELCAGVQAALGRVYQRKPHSA